VLRWRTITVPASWLIVLALGSGPALVAQTGTATIAGQLVDGQSRAPVGGARVGLLGAARELVSDSTGRFSHAGLTAGTYVVQVRAIGYSAASWIVELREGEVHNEVFQLQPLPYVLDTVRIERPPSFAEARRRAFDLRRASGRGYFITLAQIEAQQPRSLADLLRNVPGVRMTCRGSGRCTVRMARGPDQCNPEYVLDGFPATNSTSLDMSPAGIIGIEVYSALSETPIQFLRADNTCGTIVIWTRSEPRGR
jgi:hypothetical protein